LGCRDCGVGERGAEIDVHWSLAAEVQIGKPGLRASRRGTALLAVFAVLLQAILFAWHAHPLQPSLLGTSDVRAATAAAGHQTPATADDDCQICFALGHQSTAPVGFMAAVPRPDHVSLPLPAVEAVAAPLAAYLLFRSRAPPRA
jgi:hypothetical protein